MSQDDNFFNEPANQNPNIETQGSNSDKSTANGLGIAGLIVGIVALLVSFVPCFGLFALFIGIIGIVLSGIGLYMANKGHFDKGLLIGGLVISILATLIALFQWTVAGTALSQAEKANGTWVEQLKEMDEASKELEEKWNKELEESQMRKDSLDVEITD